VETIHSDAERMSRIVSEVLDLARIEAGRLELNLADINVATVADKAAAQVAKLPGADRLSVDVQPELTVHADATRLEHIVTNLVENGIKFSDKGPVRLSAEPSEGQIAITVTDEGVGIEEERMPHVFSGPAPTGQGATPIGTGLGLYLTKRLVEAHGGSVEVQSVRDRGSRFTVKLPAAGGDGG
jgi:signal transduction histidine kinase